MQVCAGSRILEPWHSGGDPQAPLAAKVYLQRALKELHRRYPQLHTDLWIDDLSFDVVDRNPNNAARVAIQAYEFVKSELEKDNLKVSPQCGGQADPTGTPPCRRPKGARRDEGFRSRLQTMKVRGQRAGRKTKKLDTLKIPQRAIRLKLYKGSVLAGINWGHEAMGLAPHIRKRIRTTTGRQIGFQRTGNADILFDMYDKHRDPDYGAFTDHVRLYRKLAKGAPA